MVSVGSVIATQKKAAHRVPFPHRFRKYKAIPSSNASNNLTQIHPHSYFFHFLFLKLVMKIFLSVCNQLFLRGKKKIQRTTSFSLQTHRIIYGRRNIWKSSRPQVTFSSKQGQLQSYIRFLRTISTSVLNIFPKMKALQPVQAAHFMIFFFFYAIRIYLTKTCTHCL